MSAITRRLLAVLILALAWAAPAFAEKRVALVIGNGAYKHAPALANPRNDAEGMAAALRRMKFEVVSGIDLDKPAMERLLRDFVAKLDNADLALVFYAGHGLQVHGRNYFVPVDAKLERETDLAFEAVSLELVQQVLEQTRRTNILILDACRDNPLARNLARAMGTRQVAIGRGLGQAQAGIGTLIVYATQPGNVALDGEGTANSPFTTALLKHIETPGLEIRLIVSRVRQAVIEATRDKQVPWDSSSLVGEVYLSAAPKPPQPEARPPAAPSAPATDEVAFWQGIRDSRSAGDFRAYLERWPSGLFASLARARIAEIERASAEESKRAEEQRRKVAEDQRADAERKARAEEEAKRKAADDKARAEAEAKKKAEEGRKRAEETKPGASDPKKQAQTADSWYAVERKRGLLAFAHKRATLEPGAVAALEKLTASLQGQKDYTIRLTAEADRSEGSAAELQALSRNRLAAIRQWLATKGVPAASVRTGIGPVRGEGSEFRNIAVVAEIADAKATDRSAPPPAGSSDQELIRRLSGAAWQGAVSAHTLGVSSAAATGSATIQFVAGGRMRFVGQVHQMSARGQGLDRFTSVNDDGSWSVAEGKLCAAFRKVEGGARRCYAATLNDDGSVTLSGAGLLGGKRFASGSGVAPAPSTRDPPSTERCARC